MKRYPAVFALAPLLMPSIGLAASREQLEMQRDIAQLQEQIRALESSFDQKMAALQTLAEQAIEAGNKANASVAALSTTVGEKLDSVSKGALLPLAGIDTKLDTVVNNQSTLVNSVASLQEQVNRQQQLLSDINNAIKVLQSPPVAPPEPTNAVNAPPPASVLWETARRDFATGKLDLAADDYVQFLQFYPEDADASEAQFMLGRIHTAQNHYDQAVMDFDAVLERYPDSKFAPDASFAKGMALKAAGQRGAAEAEFRGLIKKYPRSERVRDAQEQLRALAPKRKP